MNTQSVEYYAGGLAVVTGGGYGMGRSLVLQLASAGCDVAACDVSMENLEATAKLAEAHPGTVSIHRCDVSSAEAVAGFKEEVASEHGTARINFLFNNAGIGGGGSFVDGGVDEWERTFNVCWSGVYLMCRAFLPMLMAAERGHVINTSSVNGFWAAIGQETPHTAYSAAKFAVKGFTEALKTDLAVNAPHLRCSVVMPGHIGTGIARNSAMILGGESLFELTDAQVAATRARLEQQGMNLSNVSDQLIRDMAAQRADDFEHNAPMTADDAATVILDAAAEGRWRILVGDDAHRLDELVRSNPEGAYEPAFYERLNAEGVFGNLMQAAAMGDPDG